ncbi:uncharacterized protein LOC124196410 [Daphnia pulex]|uniref:uncharacterized protein LOC124196410 n=1 Tax=Daphnia pulex TaxID=6669 RepID=UPI001EDCEC5D|nr:uncharacterized protein LOC124196410 [Daphnia pulex]
MFTTVIFMAQFARIYSNLSTVIDSVSRSRRISVIERSIDYSMYLASIVTNQGNILAVNRLSFRFLVGTWALVATVLVNSYSSTVISYMTVSKNKPAINTFEDLVASENVELIVLADTTTKKQIMEAESAGAMKTLGDQIRNNPSRILNNLQKVSDLLETERYAFPNPQSFCNNFVASQFQKKGQCRFKTTDPLSMNIFLSVPLQKNSKFTPIFKHALLQLWETGLPQHWVKSSMPQAPKCFQKTNLPNTAIPKPIKLGDLTGAFLILGVGFGLATFFFLMENIIRCRSLRTATIGQK